MGDSTADLAPAFDRLNSLLDLEANWDTYGANQIKACAVETASNFLRDVAGEFDSAPAHRLAPYNIVPLHNGGVQIEWRKADRALEIEFSPDGNISYLAVLGAEPDWQFDSREAVTSVEARRVLADTLFSGAAR